MIFLKKIKQSWRFYFVYFCFLFSFIILAFHLYDLQIENNLYYQKKAQAREDFKESEIIKRGNIYFTDKNNDLKLVATNKEFPLIYLVPKEIENVDLIIEKIKELNLKNFESEEELKIFKEKISNKKNLFYPLKEKPTAEEVEKIKSLNLKGLYVKNKFYRYYPFSNLASHLIGFVGFKENLDYPVGLYGIEKYYDKELTQGEDIKLTIDLVLQKQSEIVLENLIKNFQAKGGSIIIQEPTTGKILALSNKPDFDLNNYQKSEISYFLNPIVQSLYEPGSVLKVITMAIGLETKKITPETKFLDKGFVILNNKTIRNWDKKANGLVTMSQIIERSINTGAVFVESKIGHKDFYNYLKKFGFEEITNIDLPYEIKGNLNNLKRKDFQDVDYANASFGQGIALTPISLVNAFSAIANGGVLMRPYLNNDFKPEVIRRVISKEASEEVIKMMESAVVKAKIAAIPYYRVAGKTGTAQIPDFKNGGYLDEYNHTFIGFAPVSNPRFTILIKLERPKAELAGLTVVPAFRELTQFILNYYNISPDKLENELEKKE